jgi:hypothetical protein
MLYGSILLVAGASAQFSSNNPTPIIPSEPKTFSSLLKHAKYDNPFAACGNVADLSCVNAGAYILTRQCKTSCTNYTQCTWGNGYYNLDGVYKCTKTDNDNYCLAANHVICLNANGSFRSCLGKTKLETGELTCDEQTVGYQPGQFP